MLPYLYKSFLCISLLNFIDLIIQSSIISIILSRTRSRLWHTYWIYLFSKTISIIFYKHMTRIKFLLCKFRFQEFLSLLFGWAFLKSLLNFLSYSQYIKWLSFSPIFFSWSSNFNVKRFPCNFIRRIKFNFTFLSIMLHFYVIRSFFVTIWSLLSYRINRQKR